MLLKRPNCLLRLMPHAVRIRASDGRRWITSQHNSTCHCQFRIVAESICGSPSDTASRSGSVDNRSPTVRTPGSSSRSAVVLSIDRAFSSVLPISPQKLSCSHSKSGATAAGIVAFATVDSGNATDFEFAAAFFSSAMGLAECVSQTRPRPACLASGVGAGESEETVDPTAVAVVPAPTKAGEDDFSFVRLGRVGEPRPWATRPVVRATF